MGIFTKPRPEVVMNSMQPQTVPIKSSGTSGWMPPQRAGPLPANYTPPAPVTVNVMTQMQPPAPRPQVQQQPAPAPQPFCPPEPPIVVMQETQPDLQPTVVASNPDAPVFVKIDKYEEILTELSDMKATMNNVRNLAEVFNLVREVQLDSVSILDGLMKELERSQIKLDKILGRLEDVEERVRGSRYESVKKMPPAEIDDIEDRIRKIREEIGKLNKG
jgi:hypothetical protein